jgi:hypothetical protein
MNNTISNLKMKALQASMIVTALLVLTACGSTTATSSTTGGASSLNGTTGVTTTPTPSNVGNIYDLPDADAYVSSINGAGGAVPTSTYSVQTSRTLKVKVTPLAAPNLTLPGYTNWVFPYGCMEVQVTVNGVTKSSGILQVDGVAQQAGSICANSPTFAVLDFSNDVSGNGTSNVTISNPEYDNCRYVNPLTYGCGMSAIFKNHLVSSNITIQTDGTYMSTTTAN